MKRFFKSIIVCIVLAFFFSLSLSANASSYMADKTEIVVDLDVAGAEVLCQTDDGYVWIGQYSGLTRYDSKEQITYKSFKENDIDYDIINVRSLATYNNTLYILTYRNVFKYENNEFSTILKGVDDVKALLNENKTNLELHDLVLNNDHSKLYISSLDGLFIYDLNNNTFDIVKNSKGKNVSDCEIYSKTDDYYFVAPDGVYSKDGRIFESDIVLDICIFDDIMLISTTDGVVRYNIALNNLDERQYDMVNYHVNKAVYSKKNNTVFLATEEKGLVSINEETFDYSIANTLANYKQLIDVMVDYENNIWIASHNVSSSGVSIITNNALVNLLYDDAKWKSATDKRVNAVDKIGNILYICSKSGLYTYDLLTNKISNDSDIIMNKVDEYLVSVGLPTTYHDFRDVELFNNEIYFALYGVGLVKYNPTTNDIKIYGDSFINDANNVSSVNVESLTDADKGNLRNVRALRAFDNFIVIGCQNGPVIKLENEKYYVYRSNKSIIYINKSIDGQILVDQTDELYTLSSDLKTKTTIPTETSVVGNRLKFLVDGNKIYYTLNSRLFCAEKEGNEYKNYEVVVPKVKGSIVELSKVKVSDNKYKYVMASQSQVYIIDSLSGDNIDSHNQIINYEIYDSTNGLQSINANTSGFYDEDGKKYYFQTTEGVFTYNFNVSLDNVSPLKIAIKAIDVDGKDLYGTDLTIDKNTNRLVFDLAVLGFRPNKGYSVYYKLDGVDSDYVRFSEGQNNVSYTNLKGGKYVFHAYALDEFNQKSNEITITIVKPMHLYEQVFFWILVSLLGVAVLAGINFYFIHSRAIKAEKREAELKEITIESIEAIARTIDAKDSYTNGHSIRVGYFSRLIAKELGVSGDDLENLYYIALLHDIGKIGIPDAILNKPGRLTDEEFDIMKSHTTKGAKILADISTIPNIVEGAKYHHEKYGGGGYPEGLVGEDIPYIARIICCADCFDAMATRRVYKDPYPKEKIISEFERCKNIQFDPTIADVVIKLIKEGKLKTDADADINSKIAKSGDSK